MAKCSAAWEQRLASGWKWPLTRSQNSRVLTSHLPWMPTQHGLAITSQLMCRGAAEESAEECEEERHTGHEVRLSAQVSV